MAPGQLAVTRDAGIRDPGVQGGADGDFALPVLGREFDLQARRVAPRHADDAPLPPARDAALLVAKAHVAHPPACGEIEPLVEIEDLDPTDGDPRTLPEIGRATWREEGHQYR